MVLYNFVESQNDPANDPVILWQQGGPGSRGFGEIECIVVVTEGSGGFP